MKRPKGDWRHHEESEQRGKNVQIDFLTPNPTLSIRPFYCSATHSICQCSTRLYRRRIRIKNGKKIKTLNTRTTTTTTMRTEEKFYWNVLWPKKFQAHHTHTHTYTERDDNEEYNQHLPRIESLWCKFDPKGKWVWCRPKQNKGKKWDSFESWMQTLSLCTVTKHTHTKRKCELKWFRLIYIKWSQIIINTRTEPELGVCVCVLCH